jgi:hypothetical protein
VHSHQAWFVTDPAVGDKSRVSIFCDDGQRVLGGP